MQQVVCHTGYVSNHKTSIVLMTHLAAVFLVIKQHIRLQHKIVTNLFLVNTRQKMKFSIKDFFSKYDQIRCMKGMTDTR